MDIQQRKKESHQIFNDIAKTYDGLNKSLSMGIDRYWRWFLKKNIPQKNALKILDLATGTADVPIEISKLKNVDFIHGIDMSEGMLQIGQKKIMNKKLSNKITLSIDNANKLSFADETFDVATVSFGIRNFSQLENSIKETFRVLKPHGQYLILELSLPSNFFLRAIYLFYFRKVLPFIGNLLSGHKDAYSYLNKTVEDFPCGKNFADIIQKQGFQSVSFYPLTFGIATLYVAKK